MNRKIVTNNFIPNFVPENLPWYERLTNLLTYIDRLQYRTLERKNNNNNKTKQR